MRAMRAIFYLILIISAYLFIKSLLEPKPRSPADKIRSRTRAADIGSDMVQDLYCNTFIPKESAIKEVISGKVHFFCSKECSNKFKAKV